MNEKIVTSQAELDAIPVDYNGRIIIKFGAPYNRAVVNKRYAYSVEARDNSSVEAWGNSSVEAWGNSSVEARGNSSVVARDNSSVVARGNSSVVAWDNSSVEAWGNSSVVARDNSSVGARDNSSVEAWGNSSVEAWDNSSVEAWGNSSVVARDNSSVVAWGNSSVVAWGNSSVVARDNSQIVDAVRRGNVKVSGNARVVYNPDNITAWAEGNDIPIIDGKIKLYKAVHKRDTEYVSDWDRDFFYEIGEMAVANGFTVEPEEDCGQGIHMATASWACAYAQSWDDIALLELEVDAAEIVVPLYETGKVRAPKAKVLREVPLEEAGLLGKMIARRLNRQ
nr:MAG TPA: hypothetical protein [Caudoviricetes sp.]